MIRWPAIFVLPCLLAGCQPPPSEGGAVPAGRNAAHAPSADRPVVLELFQSQGCSSCPPANANLNALAGRDDVLALNFAVTYWDQLGWRDRFASPAFTERQWDYARANRRQTVWTPQLVVNGQADTITGRDASQIDSLIARAGRPRGGPEISLASGEIRLGARRNVRPAIIWLVQYDPRELNVPVTAGENDGRTLAHRNIVRSLIRLGEWTGAPQQIDLPPVDNAAWRRAVLVQRGSGGSIIAARRIEM